MADGALLEEARWQERWLALGPDQQRVTVMEIPHPDGYRVVGLGGDGVPIEEIGPSTYELRIASRGGESLASFALEAPHTVHAAFSPDGTTAVLVTDLAVVAWDVSSSCERWRVARSGHVYGVACDGDVVRVAGPASERLALRDGSTLTGPALVPHATSSALPPVRAVAMSRDGAHIAAKAPGHFLRVTIDEGEWHVVRDEHAQCETLVHGPDEVLWIGEGRAVSGERVETAPGWPARWSPGCWSASGGFVAGYQGDRLRAALEIRGRSGAVVRSTMWSARDTVATFEGETLVVFSLGQLWRSRPDAAPLLHAPREIEPWLAHDNLVAALAPARLRFIDRRTQPRCVRPDRIPEHRRLRVVDHTTEWTHVRVLRSWTHVESGGDPVLALSADGRRALEAVAGRPEVRVWDVDRGVQETAIDLSEDGDAAASLAISRDGKVIAIGTTRGRVLRYEWSET